jgi:hypothetical protein
MRRKRGKRDTEKVKSELAKGMLRHCKYCAKRGMQKAGDKKWFLYRVAMLIIYAGGTLPL